jgi:adenylate cyclase class IV
MNLPWWNELIVYYLNNMSRAIEVELKFEIVNTKQIDGFLKEYTYVDEKHIIDVYLDTNDGDFFQRGIFIRIRNGSKLDIKFNKEDIGKTHDQKIEHNHCDEVSLLLPLTSDVLDSINDTLRELHMTEITSANIDEFKTKNNLIESITFDKKRRTFEGKGYEIDIDTVKDLGEYLEIEKLTDEKDDPKRIINNMKKLLKGLELHPIDTGYNELYWRKNNFDLYLKGKYFLAEDREKYRKQTL